MADARPPGVLSRQLILSLYLPTIMLALGESMVAPVIPGLTKSFGIGVDAAALVFVAYSAGSLVATFPTGYLMDKIGRRPVLLSGLLVTAAGSFMTPFSSTFYELLFWRFVVGAAGQLWQQGRVLVIVDTAPQDQRARQMQWMVGVTRTGQLFGPSFGGFLAAAFALWIPFAIHAALTIMTLILAYNTIKETAPGRRPKSDDSEEVKAQGWGPVIKYMLTFQIVVFLCIQVFAQFARGGQESGALNLYAVYAYDLGPGELGLLNTIAILFGIPVPFLTGYLMDKFGRRAVIAPGFAAYGIAVALMSLTAFYPLPMSYFLATYVLVQATLGTTGGTMQVLGTDLSPRENRGRFFAIWRTIAALGATIAPAIYGLIAEHAGFGFAFLYLSLCAVGVVLGLSRVLADTQAKR